MERVPFQCDRDIFSEFLNVFSTLLNQHNVFTFLSIVLFHLELDLWFLMHFSKVKMLIYSG